MRLHHEAFSPFNKDHKFLSILSIISRSYVLSLLEADLQEIQQKISQGYDGANVVSGQLGGVQKLIRDVVPRAVYVHCSNHSLDLVLAYACSLQLIKSFFGTVKSIIKFISSSPKRKKLLAQAIESTTTETRRRHLVRLCDTRWVEKHNSIIVFKQLFLGIIVALEYFVDHGDSETSGLSRAYVKALRDIDFAIPLGIVSRVFSITKPYVEQLRKPTCDLIKCYQRIEQISTYLAELIYDNNQLDELYNEFVTFAEANEIDIYLSRTASCHHKTTKCYFKHVYEVFINTTIQELGRRFTEHQKIAMTISSLIPSFVVNTNFSNVSTLFDYYKDDLKTDDTNIHKAEFDTRKFMIQKLPETERPTTTDDTMKNDTTSQTLLSK
ncbi:unnamed protein product [Rotaria sp. Silwood2]|nr:unnamed protein product [Rotaria sp. Silwood2]